MLHLKIVYTVLKVPDDFEMMHVHGFHFSKRKHTLLRPKFKEHLRRGKQVEEHQQSNQEVLCA